MGELKGTTLHHVMKVSWESEQMPGWEDSLSMILEATKKEFQIKNKETVQKSMGIEPLVQDAPEVEEEITM